MLRDMQVATLGLGGNIGDPVASMAAVIQLFLKEEAVDLLEVSRLYRTPPWGKLDQPEFYNSCIKIATSLTPLELLDFGLGLELSLKRERIERWGPRTIDIDVLTYGEMTLDHERLVLPHPRMHERAFVLMPLSDVAPEIILKGQRIKHWLDLADQSGIDVVEKEDWWKR